MAGKKVTEINSRGMDEMENVEEMAEAVEKQPVNIMDLLLGSDIGEIKLPSKQVEITRLSELYNSPFILTVSAISPDKYEEIQDMAVSIKGKDADVEVTLFQQLVVMEGVLDPAGKPLFKNKDLMNKFNAKTPKELIKKILLSGEIANIYSEISTLSGFGEGSVKAVKN